MNFSKRLYFYLIGVIVIISTLCFITVWQIHVQNNLRESKLFYERFIKGIENDKKALAVALVSVLDREDLKEAFDNKDRNRLLSIASRYFKEVKGKFEITHLYFHNLDLTVFLRAHKPEQFNDKINRFTLTGAAGAKKITAGLELGLTAFALRVVGPAYKDGKLIGYMEVGQEIDKILEEFKQVTGADISLVVKKSFLDKTSFIDKQFYKDKVIFASTDKAATKEILSKVDNLLNTKNEFNNKLLLGIKNQNVFCQSVKLFDAGNRDVGNIIITTSASRFMNSLMMTLLIVLFILIVSIVLLVIVLRNPIRTLNNVKDNLSIAASNVLVNSQQFTATSQQLAESNNELASSIEDTSSTLAETASMIRQTTENTKQAAVLALQANSAADKGNLEMQEMMTSMNEIKKSSDHIAKIIKVIDDIAFQTNILALNAAIEAASAGDAGMGFAVVAEEVRNLAQRSAQAAKDTAVIIESNIELSKKGVNGTMKVGESLSDITLQAKKVNDLMNEILAASQEHSHGILQINNAVAQMEKVTQHNAASAEESSASAEELFSQAEILNKAVRELLILLNGSNKVDDSKKAISGSTSM